MELIYHKQSPGNFGDELNQILWKRVLSPLCWKREDALLVGIGTVFDNWYLRESKTNGKLVIVCGSGAGYSNLPQGWPNPKWIIAAVRGPLTAELIGRPDTAVTDAAILLASAPDLIGPRSARDTLFIPHCNSIDDARWQEVCQRCALTFVDPRWPLEYILSFFARARLVVAEAMHGAIVADTLRIPWIPVVCSPAVLQFKWIDWCESMDISYEPFQLPPTGAWDALWRKRIAASIPLREPVSTVTHNRSEVKDAMLRAFRERGHGPSTPSKSKSGIFYTAKRGAIRVARLANSFPSERFLDAAAKQLTEICTEPAILSSDIVFADRLDKMRGALEIVEQSLTL